VSDDHGVYVQGAGVDNEIAGNHIFGGLIGISCTRVRSIAVHHNRIHNMSSLAIVTMEGVVDGRFHDNVVDDCNIGLRIHHYNTSGDNERREYHYHNRFSGQAGVGDHVFVHWLDDKWPANTRHAEIWIYENDFVDGRGGIAPSGLAIAGGGLQRTRVINNVFRNPIPIRTSREFNASRPMLAAFDYNAVLAAPADPAPAWWGDHNSVVAANSNERNGSTPLVAMNHRGLDLSRSFQLEGETYPALPGAVRRTAQAK
jgi:hypothetical protein